MLPDFRLRQREYLLEISRAMSARLDLSSLLELTLKSAVELMAGQAGLITLRQDDGKMTPWASIGLPVQAVPLFEPLWQGFEQDSGDAAPADISLRLALASRAAGVQMRQVVALPMEIGKESIGLIFIFRTRGAAFSPNDRQVLSAFADQAAVAVHNARLYQQVSAERERLNAIIENSGDGVMILNPYRIIQTWNNALTNMTGITAENAIGRPCYEILNLQTKQGVSVCHTACPLINPPGDGRLYAEGQHHRADGIAITLADNYSPQVNDAGQATQFVANVRDMTRLREAEELKQTLLSVISHELKTPVSIIKGYAGTLAREDANWDKETLADGLQVIEEEADRLDRLITNLLEASRLQAGGLKLKLSLLSLEDMVRASVEKLQATTTKHRFLVSFAPNFPPIQGDHERLREVITNLLGNAIKYSPDGGTITVTGQLGPHNTVRLSVQDEGIGIPPSDQEKIFDRFHRVDNRLARQQPGTGLGLFLVKAVVEAHNGKVWVESSPGKGSTFWVELPAGTSN
ncbi:MAG: PAS domain S-box protein [Chloroflexi bacterium]|nr:MAG: PAS domain S-box protein [Chloroflexota bacterium]